MDDRLIAEFKVLTGESEEGLLSLLLLRAESVILAETNRTKILPEMKGLLFEVGLELYNRSGAEGEASRSEGGISVSYRDDFSPHIKKLLNSYTLARSGGCVFEKK